ncbi:MAG: DUF805 domain-containing protein [Alteraurantiacibacter sp.]
MIAETKHCLRNLTKFEGRDSRQTFWYYILALVLFQMALGVVIAVPLMMDMFSRVFSAAQNGVPPEQMSAMMMGQMGPMVERQITAGAVLAVISAALFVAAFVRRLHDSNKPGWIALIPLLTVALGQYLAFTQVGQMMDTLAAATQSGDMEQLAAANRPIQIFSLVGWVGYLVVIVFGALQSTPGPNRYGDAPAEV